MSWTPGSNPSRSAVVGNLKEANRLLKSMDESVRYAIQQWEADIASTDCTVQFWREPLLLEDPIEDPPDDRDEAGSATSQVRKSRGYQVGWSNVGNDWHLAYREATRISFPNPNQGGPERLVVVPAGKARPLVDAPRLLKAASIDGLNDFVNELAHFVIEMTRKIQNGLTNLDMKEGGAK
jgi:hypothetical protein